MVFSEDLAEEEAMKKEDLNKDTETRAMTEEAKDIMAQEKD